MQQSHLFALLFGRRRAVSAWLVASAWASLACGTASPDGEVASGEQGVSAADVVAARSSHQPKAIAKLTHALASRRLVAVGEAVAQMTQLFEGLDVPTVASVRAAYIKDYNEDPEITFRSHGLLKPLVRLSDEEQTAMFAALNGAQAEADASVLSDMNARASRGSLRAADRSRYFAMMPRMGLWDAPARANARGLDSMERSLLKKTWASRGAGDFDAALRRIEDRLPAPALAPPVGRDKAVAVVASSHGAQWQELMGWAVEMRAKGYHLQIFSAEGRPLAFQRDSMTVSPTTAPLGFGSPAALDPAGPTGLAAAEILGNTVGASRFDASQFGAVYLAGGLGFNEDIAFAQPKAGGGTSLTANPNVATLMAGVIEARLPIVGLCHGPTLLAAISIRTANGVEALNKGVATASLPPFEFYVGLTKRKERQFVYDVNTHNVLAATGGKTNVLADIAKMGRVVESRKGDLEIITGPGPQAATALAKPTMAAMARRWSR